MLLFKKKFLPAIREGTKTQTVRVWKVCRYRAGQRSYIPGAGYITIETIEPTLPEQLTEHDAVRDGFTSLAELRAELNRIYPAGLQPGEQLYRVCFRLLSPEEQTQAIAAREAKKHGG